jgi:ankyrin repeat protein
MSRTLLRNVIKSGNIQLVAECLQQKQVKETLFTYNDELYTAAKFGYTDICQLLIAQCHQLKMGCTKSCAMLLACQHGHLSTARFLAVSVLLNIGTPLYWTAMLRACCCGSYNIVGWLLDMATTTPTDCLRWWLAAAAGGGDTHSVQLLAERIGVHNVVAMNQALRTACHGRELDVVEYLLRHTAADVSRRGHVVQFGDSMTPLMAACDVGYVSMSMKLLQCVTSYVVKNDMNSTRNTLLHLAVWNHTTNSTALQLYRACVEGQGAVNQNHAT